MIQSTLALAAFTGKEVLIIDGTRYYTPEVAVRLGARGSLNLFEYDPHLGHSGLGAFKLAKHSDLKTAILDANDTVVGDGDVWNIGTAKRYSPPNLIYTNAQVQVTTVRDFWNRFRQDTLVWDMRLVLHARGKEGGGRGKTERAPMVEWSEIVEGDLTSSFLQVRSTNTFGDYDDSGVYHSTGHQYDRVFAADHELYVAGRNFVFTSRDVAQSASDAGLIGQMPARAVETNPEVDDLIYSLGVEYDRADRPEGHMSHIDFQRRVAQLFTDGV